MSLSKEILKGTYEGVERLLSKGAQVNVLDEYGFTPLIHATGTNRLELVQLLLKNNADPNLLDMTGNTALHWAVDNDNLEISRALLQFGAQPNAFNESGQPVLFYPLLRKNQALVKLLIDRGASLNFAKDFIMTKLIGHRFELKGSTDVVTAEGLFLAMDLEGFYLEFTLSLICDSLDRFIHSYMAHRMNIHSSELRVIIESFKNAYKLREFKHFSKDEHANKHIIFPLLGIDLLMLPVSYEGHAINYIKHGNFLAKCDRGVEKMTDPIVIYTMGNQKSLEKEFLLKLLYRPQTAKFIKSDLHQILELKPYAKLPIKHQITGNCSWANTESAVPTMLYMLLHDQIKDKSKVDALVGQIITFYNAWLEWDKDRAIEDCLADFDKLSFNRQKSRAALLGAVLFQACNPNKPGDVTRAEKILKILSKKDFNYVVRIYANIFVSRRKTSQGVAYQQLIEKCGYKLSQFSG